MPDIDLSLVMRWLHILAGMTAVGGMVFSRFALLPSVGVLSEEQHNQLKAAIRARWSKIVAAAIAVLLVSGLTNFIIVTKYYNVPKPAYQMIWGIKFLIALVVFFISSILAGRTSLAEKFRAKAKFWLNLNLALAVVIVVLSGMLKVMPHTPKTADPPATAQLAPR